MGLSVAPCCGSLQEGLTAETKQDLRAFLKDGEVTAASTGGKSGQIGTQCQCGLLGEAAGW